MFRVTLRCGYEKVSIHCPYLKDVKTLVDAVVQYLDPGVEFIVTYVEAGNDRED